MNTVRSCRNSDRQRKNVIWTTHRIHVWLTPKRTHWSMTFGGHKIVRSEPFLDYLYEVWHCRRYIATCRKKFTQMHIYVPVPKQSRWNFLKSLSYLYKVMHTTFSPIFGVFEIFDRKFRENCGATWRRKCELCSASESEILTKKAGNRIEIEP